MPLTLHYCQPPRIQKASYISAVDMQMDKEYLSIPIEISIGNSDYFYHQIKMAYLILLDYFSTRLKNLQAFPATVKLL